MKIIITGSSEGIGFETAKLLASKNHSVTLVSRNRQKLENALSLLKGNDHQILVADLATNDGLEIVKNHIESKNYNVLINNAGVGMYGSFTELSLRDQTDMMNLNINALTTLSYCFLKYAKKGDALVNISSVLGTTSSPGSAVYAATKGYVTNFSKSLWWDYKRNGIYVMGFCPGVTYTNFHEVSGGNKNSFSKAMVQLPEKVAEELVTALENRRSPIVVSGLTNRIFVQVLKFLPLKVVLNLMGNAKLVKSK